MQCLKAERDDLDVTPMPVVLDRVGAELRSLAGQVDRLQDGLAPLLMRVVHEAPHAMAEIQGLDSIAQTLANLSDFVYALGCAGPAQPVAIGGLADGLLLSDLADRLRGHACDGAEEDFELF